MTVQVLTLGKRRFVVVGEEEFRRLQSRAQAGTQSPRRHAATTADRRDARLARRRLAAMRRSGQSPIPYAAARKKLGLA